MNKLDKLKLKFWKLGLLKTQTCPLCKQKLLKTGFPDEFWSQKYKCENKNCKLNKI
jgi:hypothetical protein